MVITLTLPDNLAQALQAQAEIQRLNMLDLITALLKQSLNLEPQDELLMQLIQEIKATPPNPAAIRPAQGSLQQALQNAPTDPEFDLATWTAQWQQMEMEMKAITQANALAEGLV